MSNVGFIGTGIMGFPMAQHLQSAGHQLFVSEHRNPARTELVAAGATALPTIKAVAEAADIIICMVPDTPDVEAVLFDDEGIAAGLSAGKLVIDMSTISPLETKIFAKKINTLGCDYLDAPVSGGEVGAQNATLTIMVGGPTHAFERALPLLNAMGGNVTLIGDNGDGQTCKVANNIIVTLNIEAVSEALVFAAKTGADPVKVREALMGGFAASKVLEVHGERMLNRTFEPGFRIRLHQKDLNLALDGAREMGIALPNTANTQELFNVCAAKGGRDWDHSALIRALETMSDFEID